MTVGTDAEAAPRPPLALELLVHGVGGTTPERMLDDPRTVCLAGDDTAGVHRRACDADAEEHPEQHREAPVPEAYCWSNLTSGNGSRALWLLLLPFMVANLAHWMRPPSHRRTLSRGYGAAVRLLALTLTVLLVAAACEVALDLVGWQCAGSARCVRGSSWLGFAAAGRGGWWSEPGRRLALAALVPAALTALLWWLSHRTWSAYESQRPAPGAAAGPGTPSLALPGFWYGRRSVARLRAAHTAAGLLTVAAAVAVPALRHDQGGGSVPLRALGWALAGLICCLALAAVAVTCRAARSEAGLDDATDHRSSRALLAASAAVLAAAACYAAWHRPAWAATGRLPTAQAFTALTILQGALIAALALLAALLHRSPPPESVPADPETEAGQGDPGEASRPVALRGLAGPAVGTAHAEADTEAGQGDPGEASRPVALRGLAGPAVGLLACGLGGVLTGGVAQRAADWLDRGRTPGEAGSPLAGPPAVLTWEASVIPVVLALLAATGAAVAWRLHRRERALCGEVEAAYPDEQHRPARTRQIAGAVARAGLTDSAPLLVAVVCAAAFVLGAAAVAGALTGGGTPGDRAADAPAAVAAAARAAQALGSWLVGAGVVALVALGRRAYRDPAARRTVGILWDVGTFWPRAAHPFAPPCYAERAVPDLSWRMESWTARTGGRIILSGHSQGSVLSAAAVWQLDPATRGRVALLTYGCPLTRLYGRWFPAYFGQQPLDGLHRDMHAWRNLWRRTDPIGGPVGLSSGGGVDRGPLLDPAAYGRSAGHPLPEPVRGHSDFQADPAFARERAALLARLLPAGGKSLPAQGISGRSSG